jgi:hypothetical protein
MSFDFYPRRLAETGRKAAGPREIPRLGRLLLRFLLLVV